MIRKIERLIILSVFLIISASVSAQEGAYGAYSPYSIFGIGEISKEGTAYNKSMGGTGIASRNRRYINYLNPAAVTERDSLSFMADFGLAEKNTVFAQNNLRSAKNTFNIYDIILSFPIYKSSAFMVGITPYSDIGYDFSSYETNPEVIAQTGNITYDSYGTGSVYQLFAGAGVTFWKNLSLGAELIYYFGNLDKVTNVGFEDSYRSINQGSEIMVKGVTGKFGLQYEHKFSGGISMILGATYKMGTPMRGFADNYAYAVQSSVTDTLSQTRIDTLDSKKLRFGDELGLGISIKGGEKWSAEFNYLRSDWRRSGMDTAQGFSSISENASFSSTVSHSFRAGFEIVPNISDIRYYLRRCAYRAGFYYDKAYYKLDGNNVNSMGITLGMTLPVFKGNNGISIGVDLGQRASTRNNMIRERYAMFVLGFNIHDIWFIKTRYN